MNKQAKKLLIFFFILVLFLAIKIFSLFSIVDKATIDNNFIGYYINYEEYESLIKQIENEKIVDFEGYNFIDKNPTFDKVIIKKTTLNKYDKQELIKPFIKQNYTFYKLKYNDQSYYFKTNEKAEDFKKQLLNINKKMTISIEQINSNNLELLTNDEQLNQTIEQLKQTIEQPKTEAKKITSRSSTSSRATNKTSTSKILESYTYISSHYRTAKRSNHTGVDFAAPYGTSVYSWKMGTVELAKWNGNYGNMVIINHNNGQKTRYAHLSSICCSAGQKITSGQLIGKVGSTGNSTGNHLHFEIMINNNFVNPLNYL